MPPRTRRGAPAPKSEEPPPPEPAASASASTSTPTAPRPAASRSFKLRPKAVRRADDERKALAEQEEKKLHDRVAADDARRRRENRLRGGRGRGRGRGRGDFGGLVRHSGTPDGPFSQGMASQRGGRTQGSGGGFGSGGGGGFGSGRGAGAGPGNFTVNSGPLLEEDPRLNTDMFNGRAAGDYGDDDDDDDGAAVKDEHGIESKKKKLLQSHLLPMGIKREEHRDREVVVATTAELEAAAAAEAAGGAGDDEADDSGSDMFIYNGDNYTDDAAANPYDNDNKVWPSTRKGQRSVTLIGVDGQEIEITEIDTLAEKREEIAAAKAAAAAAEATAAAEAAAAEASKPLEKEGDEAKPAAAKQKKSKPQPPKDAEEATIDEGLQAMLRDLAVSAPRQPASTVFSGEGDEQQQQQEEEKNEEAPRREGRLFLFQFPPILPTLQTFAPIPSGQHEGGRSGAGVVKQEPGDHDDVTMLDQVAPHADADAAAAVDLTGSAEGDDSSPAEDDDGRKPSDIGEGGFLGELVIRQSGRAELSWGGMTYEMMPGTDVQFLTTAVLLEDAEEKPQQQPLAAASTALAGNAFGMGPVGGKYNLVPVFSDEREWEVDEAELGVLE